MRPLLTAGAKIACCPKPKRVAAKTWPISATRRAVIGMEIPTNATVCEGDYIELNFSAAYDANPGVAHAAVTVFGSVVMMFDLKSSLYQAIDINLRIYLVGRSFLALDGYTVAGNAVVNADVTT
jgi:hypothetical protein